MKKKLIRNLLVVLSLICVFEVCGMVCVKSRTVRRPRFLGEFPSEDAPVGLFTPDEYLAATLVRANPMARYRFALPDLVDFKKEIGDDLRNLASHINIPEIGVGDFDPKIHFAQAHKILEAIQKSCQEYRQKDIKLGTTLLHLAAMQKSPNCVQWLSECGLNCWKKDIFGYTSADLAKEKAGFEHNDNNLTDYYRILQYIKNGMLVQGVRMSNRLAIFRALRCGAEISHQRMLDGNTPMHEAVMLKDPKIIAYLLFPNSPFASVKRPDLMIENRAGVTALQLASYNHHEILRDVFLKCAYISPAALVFQSISEGVRDAVGEVIYEYPHICNTRNENGDTLLHVAINKFKGDYFFISSIRDCPQTDPNAQDSNGDTPLHLAIRKGSFGEPSFPDLILDRYEWLKCLKKCGDLPIIKVDPNIGNNEGDASLHLAVRKGDERLVRLLLKHGANPYQSNVQGETPISIAEREKKKRIAFFLKSEKAKRIFVKLVSIMTFPLRYTIQRSKISSVIDFIMYIFRGY